MTDLVVIEREDRLLQIRLNRPAKKNALTQEMYGLVADGLLDAESDLGIRAVLLSGEECFTAGNDLGDFQRGFAEGRIEIGDDLPVHRFLLSLMRSTVPIIAAVDGLAIGVGTTLLLHCDMIFTTPTTRFQLPFANLGLVPEAASSYLLPKVVGQAQASELLLSGRPFSGVEAHQMGIATQLCESSELLPTALEAARALTCKAPQALRETKKLLKRDTSEMEAAFRAELEVFGRQLRSEEFAEAVSAFQEKREPRFR